MSEKVGQVIQDESSLREIVGEPMELAVDKVLSFLDKHCVHFISLSPFLCMGTVSSDGRADVSPRGDPPGFVKVLNSTELLIPDRRGNRRMDSMKNLFSNPPIGIMFFVPGVLETLRVNGRASIVKGHPALSEMDMNGKVPEVGIRVEVEEVFFH